MSVSEKLAWHDDTHARAFDQVSWFPNYLMRKRFESCNEVRLLKAHCAGLSGAKLYEIGCATGEFCRYAARYLKGLDYKGFDISPPAIARAVEKYGRERFVLLETGIDDFANVHGRAEVVFCRDVVLHQNDPYRFLDRLLEIARAVLALRLRTRDVGAAVLDAEQSCQYHYDKHWVPYIVLNTEEMIAKLSANARVRAVTVSRSYEVLGGHNLRFLPKDLYYSETRTAETAVLVRLADGPRQGEVELVFDDRPDGPHFSLFDRALLRMARSFASSR